MTICNLDGVNPLRQEFMENECEALPGVAYPGVWDNHSTLNTKTGYDDVHLVQVPLISFYHITSISAVTSIYKNCSVT